MHSASEEESHESGPADDDSAMEDAHPGSDEIEEQPFISKVPEGSIHQRSVTLDAKSDVPQTRRLSLAQDDSVTG